MGYFQKFCICIFDISILFLFSNGCVGNIGPYGPFCTSEYCFYSHLSLLMGMDMRWFLVSSYM